jgi:hypothetical protein
MESQMGKFEALGGESTGVFMNLAINMTILFVSKSGFVKLSIGEILLEK